MTSRGFSEYEQPALAVDLALMTVTEGTLKALVMRRPDADRVGGLWALPGGFVHVDVSLEDAAIGVLANKAHLNGVYLEQVGTFGALGRDPRGRVVSVAYFALTPVETFDDAVCLTADLELMEVQVPWDGETGGPVAVVAQDGKPAQLAFDHADILGHVVKRLRGKLNYTTIGLELLPVRFTLLEAQAVYEAILGETLSKPPFRRKLLDRGIIEPTGEFRTGGAYRPAELYQRKQ
ncbi:MAG: NUDIX hydrolase [Pseudomonadota bacterium]